VLQIVHIYSVIYAESYITEYTLVYEDKLLHSRSAAGSRGACVPERYRGTSLMRNHLTLGPYRRPMPRVLWWS